MIALRTHSTSLRHPVLPDIAQPLAGIVIAWSEVEQSIDADIATLKAEGHGENGKERADPAFSKRLAQWKRMLSLVHDEASPYRAAIDAIETEARELSELRNCLLHGVWCQPGPDDDVDYVILWARRAGSNPTLREISTHPVDSAYLVAVHRRVSALREALTDLMILRHGHLIPRPLTEAS